MREGVLGVGYLAISVKLYIMTSINFSKKKKKMRLGRNLLEEEVRVKTPIPLTRRQLLYEPDCQLVWPNRPCGACQAERSFSSQESLSGNWKQSGLRYLGQTIVWWAKRRSHRPVWRIVVLLPAEDQQDRDVMLKADARHLYRSFRSRSIATRSIYASRRLAKKSRDSLNEASWHHTCTGERHANLNPSRIQSGQIRLKPNLLFQ